MISDQGLEMDDPIPGVRRLTLSRPQTLNALTFALVGEIIEVIERLRYDLDCRVVIITGSGKGFCSGHDRNDRDVAPWVPDHIGGIHRSIFTMTRMSSMVPGLRALPQPVITAVNGATAGFGLMFVLGSDVAIAAESAFFVNGFNNVGGGGAEGGISYLLPRAIGSQRAAEFLLTGRRMGAEHAAHIGLVARTVPDDQLEPESLELAREMMQMPPLAVAQTKSALWKNSQIPSLDSAIDLEMKGQTLMQQTEDAQEKRAARRDSRDPVYRNR